MQHRPPLILALTSDLMIVPRLEDVARTLGFELRTIDDPRQLGAEGEPAARPVALTEPLEGPDAAFLRRLVEERPALILVDLASAALPWSRWISVIKTSAATRRIPVLAFGPHVAETELALAHESGADLVLPRGSFLHDLPKLLETWSVRPDPEALRAACRSPLSALARRGIELFNAGEYFEAHEVLEHAWMEAPEADGTVYRALLQVAVALLQVERKNARGATKMVLRVRQWLDPLPDRCKGIDLAAVKRTVAEMDESLRAGVLPASNVKIPLPP
ncbi:MAG TPA: DUF309 domain-containing protein [Anaerolineales bacterium]